MSNIFTIPPGECVYAIGDIHGYPDALRRMLDIIEKDRAERPVDKTHIIYMGDYIDRGPDSCGVIDILIAEQEKSDGVERTFLDGNHEHALRCFLADVTHRLAPLYIQWGGAEALASYGVTVDRNDLQKAQDEMKQALPEDHVKFLNGLALCRIAGDYLFVHGGVDPEVPLDRQKPEIMRMIREPFLSWPKPLEKRIVHGHTAVEAPEILPHRVNVDTGLYQGGPLTCGVFEGWDVRFLQVDGGKE